MHKIITMSDSSYFPAGSLFLKTRDKINAGITLYGPDISKNQLQILDKNNIEYIHVDPKLFDTKMQSLKFDFIFEQIELDLNDRRYKGFAFVDWDTFFINDWEHIFEKYDFDFGITVRNDQIKKRVLRAYANGGVIFARHSSIDLINFARETILKGRSEELKQYDEIWKTLEENRPIHKRHHRFTLRWWVDQTFLSSLVLKYFRENGYQKIGLEPIIFNFNNFKIGLFDCNYYNVVNSAAKITHQKNIYIKHLKNIGRNSLGLKKIKEKL